MIFLLLEEVPKKCVVVCDCGEGSICVNVKNNDGEKNACRKLIGAERNCECECYIDKGICVAVVKCAKNKKEGIVYIRKKLQNT